MFYLFMAFLIGVGVAAQSAINAGLAAGMGGQPLVAAFISFAVGTVCLGVLAVWQSDLGVIGQNAASQPWWRWLGGLIGAVFVFSTAFLAPRIGLLNLAFLLIVGQLAAGMLIDAFGLIGMPVRALGLHRFIGLAVMVAGLVVFIFGDRLGRLFSAG